VRDRAYRRAYRVVQVVLAAFLVAAWAGTRPVTFSGYRRQVVLTGLAWAAHVLPTVVVAWTEPINPDDSRLALTGQAASWTGHGPARPATRHRAGG
jgi:hypothetical protein